MSFSAQRLCYEAVATPLALFNRILTNDSSDFNSISDPQKRVKAFYTRVADETDSSMVGDDTYPVAIDRSSLVPGVMDVHRPFPGQGGSGHSQYIRTVKDNGAIGFIWNSVPPAVRMLSLTFGVSYVPRPDTPNAGFRRWIWPQDANKNPRSLPGSSQEQYSLGLNRNFEPAAYDMAQFSAEVVRRLKIRDIPPSEILATYVPSICSYIVLRAEVTARARELKAKHGSQCFDPRQFDDLSTYSRDSRLTDMFNDLFWQFAKQPEPNKPFVAPEVEKAINTACPLKNIDPANTIDSYNFLGFLANNIASSNPNDSYWVRWGYTGPHDSSCPVYK